MIKKIDLISMNLSQLEDKLLTIKHEYQNLKIQSKITSIQNPIRIRMLRKNLARIKTLINKKRQTNRS